MFVSKYLHFLFSCVLSVFITIRLAFWHWFVFSISRNSVSLLRFPFLSHFQVFTFAILLVCCLKYLYSCFSSHFSSFYYTSVLLLLLLLLVATISFCLISFMFSSTLYCVMYIILKAGKPRYYYHLFLYIFSYRSYLMVFHWSFSDSKSPEISRTLLSILAVLNNAVVWMVSTRQPISKSPSPFNNV